MGERLRDTMRLLLLVNFAAGKSRTFGNTTSVSAIPVLLWNSGQLCSFRLFCLYTQLCSGARVTQKQKVVFSLHECARWRLRKRGGCSQPAARDDRVLHGLRRWPRRRLRHHFCDDEPMVHRHCLRMRYEEFLLEKVDQGQRQYPARNRHARKNAKG